MIKYRLDMIISNAAKVANNTGDIEYFTDEEIKSYMREIIDLANECNEKIQVIDTDLTKIKNILI